MSRPDLRLAAALAAALLPAALPASIRAAADVVVTVVGENDKPIPDATVTLYPDQKSPLPPAKKAGGQYEFHIAVPATCFALDVTHKKSMYLQPLYGLSAHANQHITIVLFPRPPVSINAMSAEDAIRTLGALEGRASFPLVVGEENVPASVIKDLKAEEINGELKGAIENPNDAWNPEASKIIKDKAQKVRADLEKLPDKEESFDKK